MKRWDVIEFTIFFVKLISMTNRDLIKNDMENCQILKKKIIINIKLTIIVINIEMTRIIIKKIKSIFQNEFIHHVLFMQILRMNILRNELS